jgi:hypothetical protein
MTFGIEHFELWWIFPLVCIGMMLFCMLSGFRGRMRCCGSHQAHHQGGDGEREIPNDTEPPDGPLPRRANKTDNENDN